MKWNFPLPHFNAKYFTNRILFVKSKPTIFIKYASRTILCLPHEQQALRTLVDAVPEANP